MPSQNEDDDYSAYLGRIDREIKEAALILSKNVNRENIVAMNRALGLWEEAIFSPLYTPMNRTNPIAVEMRAAGD